MMADSESEQIFDRGGAAVCQDASKPAGCIAPSTKCLSESPLTSFTMFNMTGMCKTWHTSALRVSNIVNADCVFPSCAVRIVTLRELKR